MTMRATRSLPITFGLVTVPVKLYGAGRDNDAKFHMVHRPCGQRVNSATVCRTCDREITDKTEIIKGYPVSKEQMVLFEPEELEALPLASGAGLDLTAFVPADSVPIGRREKTYFAVPGANGKAGQKPFALLRDAMARSKLLGLGKVAFGTGKESLCVVEPAGRLLAVSLLFWADEAANVAELDSLVEQVAVSDAETQLAEQLIGALSQDGDVIDGLQDEYREALTALIDAKLMGQPMPTKVAAREETAEADLMSVLTASVQQAKAKAA
jgi:DNA end-binding protein Ku